MESFVRADKAAGWGRGEEKRNTERTEVCTETTEEETPGKIQDAADRESTEFTALVRSLGEWL